MDWIIGFGGGLKEVSFVTTKLSAPTQNIFYIVGKIELNTENDV